MQNLPISVKHGQAWIVMDGTNIENGFYSYQQIQIELSSFQSSQQLQSELLNSNYHSDIIESCLSAFLTYQQALAGQLNNINFSELDSLNSYNPLAQTADDTLLALLKDINTSLKNQEMIHQATEKTELFKALTQYNLIRQQLNLKFLNKEPEDDTYDNINV